MLDLKRPRTLELRRIAEGAWLRRLVYCACQHTWRTRRGDEDRTRSKSGAYIEIIGGKMDMPPALAFAHGQLKAMYGDTP